MATAASHTVSFSVRMPVEPGGRPSREQVGRGCRSAPPCPRERPKLPLPLGNVGLDHHLVQPGGGADLSPRSRLVERTGRSRGCRMPYSSAWHMMTDLLTMTTGLVTIFPCTPASPSRPSPCGLPPGCGGFPRPSQARCFPPPLPPVPRRRRPAGPPAPARMAAPATHRSVFVAPSLSAGGAGARHGFRSAMSADGRSGRPFHCVEGVVPGVASGTRVPRPRPPRPPCRRHHRIRRGAG